MPITSVLVKSRAERTTDVARRVGRLPGATVSNVEGDSLVVITETATRAEDKALWDRIEAIPDVEALTVVYHNFEDLDEAEEAPDVV